MFFMLCVNLFIWPLKVLFQNISFNYCLDFTSYHTYDSVTITEVMRNNKLLNIVSDFFPVFLLIFFGFVLDGQFCFPLEDIPL